MSDRASRRTHVVFVVLAMAVLAAGAWLFMQTRARTPESTPPTTAVPRRTDPKTSAAITVSTAVRAATAAPAADATPDVHTQRIELVQTMSSRPGRENWADRGEALLDEIGGRAERVADRGCYVSGCTATYTFTSRGVYDQLVRDSASWTTYTAWTGGKRWTTPEDRDDGRVVVALLLYRPD